MGGNNMKICQWCGKAFEPSEEDYEYEYDGRFPYYNFTVPLCAKCAMEAVDERADGVYQETCEKCGKKFDPFVDDGIFQNHMHWSNGTFLWDHWSDAIKCVDCTLEEL